MKLVTFHNCITSKEVSINCDSITFIEPSEILNNATEINFTGGNPLTVKEDYEEVKKKLKEYK